MGKWLKSLLIFEQALYVERGLDPHVGRLLSTPEIPRVEVAAWVSILMMEHEGKRLEVETKLMQRERLLRQITRQYMQPQKMWHPRGILGAGFLHFCPF